jgi:Acyclic terpene utilisation family protein AtuA
MSGTDFGPRVDFVDLGEYRPGGRTRGGKPIVRIANCSGYYGDRLSAAEEMVTGGPIDVLTGDWLAELTMFILAKDRIKNPELGYAKTFVNQVEQVLGTCLDRGIRIVANAGGLNPAGCARAVEEVAAKLGLGVVVGHVEGDDVLGRLPEFRAAGHDLHHLDTGVPLDDREVLTANAYFGCWGIVDALNRGADVVITGRTTDAAVVVGPAAWYHGWAREDWDALAGVVVAGHAIECGTQVTGGNYAFFDRVPGLEHPGFPIAEIAADGSSVVTKHTGHGGLVDVGTVTAQLLYEIQGPRYLGPDVTARFDSIELTDLGDDRVRISGVKGEPPPATSKLSLNLVGGAKATVSLPLVGLDIEAKAALLERTLFQSLPGGRDSFREVHVDLIRADREDADRNETAVAQLVITLKDPDDRRLGRSLTATVNALALASYPGFYGARTSVTRYGVYWPALVPSAMLSQRVVVAGSTVEVGPTSAPGVDASVAPAPVPSGALVPSGPTVRIPIGRLAGARSGDKGGNANLGVWVDSDLGYAWLEAFLAPERLTELMPDLAGLVVVRDEFPRLRALNFTIVGLLGEGVASSTRQDPQAKSLGEYFRSRRVEVPEILVNRTSAGH